MDPVFPSKNSELWTKQSVNSLQETIRKILKIENYKSHQNDHDSITDIDTAGISDLEDTFDQLIAYENSQRTVPSKFMFSGELFNLSETEEDEQDKNSEQRYPVVIRT
ncbi:11113_t:CDS:2 [Ambispora gerdemannii]|uniref:11113_t:CDS:1 n=1 Tax=Ambispora gerdemannii TaxID=144530 RepID=A0A9N9EBP4_9GLOM|nr:11113_t:CDS:2 [Ambispora gerdemannii]